MKKFKGFLFLAVIWSGLGSIFAQTPVIHAHRGGAGEYPENTIEAMIHAVSAGVRVLELDVHISADSMVVVSHDPYFHPSKVTWANGKRLPKGSQMRHILFNMSYAQMGSYDIGSLKQSIYPNRVNMFCQIPLLSDLISNVEAYTQRNGIAPVSYNIEIKSLPLKDNRLSPSYETFTRLVMDVLLPRQLGSRLIIQCFDTRTLNLLHSWYPNLKLSYLVDNTRTSLNDLLKNLEFTPAIFSPNYKMVTRNLVEEAHSQGIEVIPWTVDHRSDVITLRNMGVDAIITNYPTQALRWISE